MSFEALWYMHFVDGEPPHRRRLSRQPLQRQWEAAIDLAIQHSVGLAGYRATGRSSVTGEQTWFWTQPDGNWWFIPPRVEGRAFALVAMAVKCELRRGRGNAMSTAIMARLKRWKETGQWRKYAAEIHPRHGKPSTYAASFGPPKKRGRPRKAK